ncbi:unnamed protein product [Colletotrichum noveboracense]|uniref:Uncharacterized protein n=1 Tax=Colletotrichum noveboracense TaxID=2664923 RepID=A0A9W4RT49_9PEZI|nr:unnamed protein product [Colletotrichum noveboracense]
MGCSVSVQTETVTKENATTTPQYNVYFIFYDKIGESYESVENLRWEARLVVQASRVSSLMKKGFYLSLANELPQSGCIFRNCQPHQAFGDHSWKHLRRYILADWETGWTAHVFVGSNEMEALAEFRLKGLTTDRIAHGYAWNTEWLTVYNYDAFKPEENFNTLLEDMPLEGLWPWPKSAECRESGQDDNEDMASSKETIDDHSEGETSGRMTPDSTEYGTCLPDYSQLDRQQTQF